MIKTTKYRKAAKAEKRPLNLGKRRRSLVKDGTLSPVWDDSGGDMIRLYWISDASEYEGSTIYERANFRALTEKYCDKSGPRKILFVDDDYMSFSAESVWRCRGRYAELLKDLETIQANAVLCEYVLEDTKGEVLDKYLEGYTPNNWIRGQVYQALIWWMDQKKIKYAGLEDRIKAFILGRVVMGSDLVELLGGSKYVVFENGRDIDIDFKRWGETICFKTVLKEVFATTPYLVGELAELFPCVDDRLAIYHNFCWDNQ